VDSVSIRGATFDDAAAICTIYREQGQLDGRWVDVIVMEQLLG